VFVTDSPRSAVRYRLTYTAAEPGRLKLKFEIAPPGRDFSIYIEASARRAQ
jgi:hypothetical protein